MFESLFAFGDWGLFALRVAVGIIFIYHGLPKPKMAKAMTAKMGMPQMAGIFAFQGVVEVLAGAVLILGFWVQISAIILGIMMIGAIFMKILKWRTGFASMQATGWEFDFMILAATIALLFLGGGSISL